MPLSHSPSLRVLSTAFATIGLGFGINGILNPRGAFNVFEFPLPSSAVDQSVIDSLMQIYGARDIFMALAVYVTAWYNHRQSVGWLMIATAAVAFVDGVVVKAQIGRGEWNHWGYAPVLAVIGSLLLGVADRKA